MTFTYVTLKLRNTRNFSGFVVKINVSLQLTSQLLYIPNKAQFQHSFLKGYVQREKLKYVCEFTLGSIQLLNVICLWYYQLKPGIKKSGAQLQRHRAERIAAAPPSLVQGLAETCCTAPDCRSSHALQRPPTPTLRDLCTWSWNNHPTPSRGPLRNYSSR